MFIFICPPPSPPKKLPPPGTGAEYSQKGARRDVEGIIRSAVLARQHGVLCKHPRCRGCIRKNF